MLSSPWIQRSRLRTLLSAAGRLWRETAVLAIHPNHGVLSPLYTPCIIFGIRFDEICARVHGSRRSEALLASKRGEADLGTDSHNHQLERLKSEGRKRKGPVQTKDELQSQSEIRTPKYTLKAPSRPVKKIFGQHLEIRIKCIYPPAISCH